VTNFRGFSKPVLLIDFESTGFVKNAHGDVVDPGEPTQLGGVLLHAKTLVEEKSFLSDIQADAGKLDPWVLEHTDITPEKLANAPIRKEVAEKFLDEFGTDLYLASWNVTFDRAWLDLLMQAVSRRGTMYDYHHIDVWSLAYAYLCQHGRADVVRSEDTFQLFGQSARSAHNALDDSRRTAEILRAVLFDTGIQS
jgi:DNA polymerase III alpha subunit (gram-positive type)